MGKESLKFSNTEIEKQKFHSSKKRIQVNKVDTNNIAASQGFTYGKNGSKYFVGYKNNEVTSLWILLKNIKAYLKNFDDAKAMSFQVEDEKLLKKYNEIWSKIMKIKKFNNDPVFVEKCLE